MVRSVDEKLRIIERAKAELLDCPDPKHEAYVRGFIAGVMCDLDD